MESCRPLVNEEIEVCPIDSNEWKVSFDKSPTKVDVNGGKAICTDQNLLINNTPIDTQEKY